VVSQLRLIQLSGAWLEQTLRDPRLGSGLKFPKFTDDELKTIASPLDFVGINAYKPS
jgi:beta-glucosidase